MTFTQQLWFFTLLFFSLNLNSMNNGNRLRMRRDNRPRVFFNTSNQRDTQDCSCTNACIFCVLVTNMVWKEDFQHVRSNAWSYIYARSHQD